MRMPTVSFALVLLASLGAVTPALAAPTCTFTEECYMTLECEQTDYTVTVDRDAGVLSTIVEDLEIVYETDAGGAPQIVAQGMGSLNVLTVGAATALLTVHIGSGPAAITYYGACE